MSFSLDGLEFVRKRLEGITEESAETGQDALSILKQPGEILLLLISILLRRHQGEPPQLQHQRLMTEFSCEVHLFAVRKVSVTEVP